MNALSTWQKLSGTAFGRWLFSRIVCFKAPYFGSINPVFDVVVPVKVLDANDNVVVTADITMYVSPKK